MLRACLPSGLQELKLDLRQGPEPQALGLPPILTSQTLALICTAGAGKRSSTTKTSSPSPPVFRESWRQRATPPSAPVMKIYMSQQRKTFTKATRTLRQLKVLLSD